MRFLLFIAVLAVLLWTFLLRSIFVLKRYDNHGNEVILPEPIDAEALFQKLRTELQYPDIKNIFYNEHGILSIAGRYSAYMLLQEGNTLTVGAVMTDKRSKDMRRAEEAMCITAYIGKIFKPATPVNPYRMYKKMRHARRNNLVITAILVVALVIYSAVMLAPALDETYKVRDSYLSQYSSEITVGEAFDGFFGDPSWTAYQEGSQELIDFQGNCTFGGENVVVRITFGIYGDQFRVDSVRHNGNETSDLITASLFTAIYEQTDALASGSSDATDAADAAVSGTAVAQAEQSQPQSGSATRNDATASGEEVDIESQAVIVEHIDSSFSDLPDYAFCQLTTCTYQGDGTIIAYATLYYDDRSYTAGAFLIDADDLTILSEIQAEEAILN